VSFLFERADWIAAGSGLFLSGRVFQSEIIEKEEEIIKVVVATTAQVLQADAVGTH